MQTAFSASSRGPDALNFIEPIDPTGPADEVATELVDRAEISNGTHLVKLSKTEADIAALKAEAVRTTFSCATTKDDKATRQFRQRCVSMRTAIKAHCEALRAPAKKFAEDVLAEQRRLTALVAEVEAIPDKVITDDEKAKEKRKADESARVAAISVRIQALADLPVQNISADSNTLALLIADLETRDLAEPPEDFAEFVEQATTARDKALAALQTMHDAATEREAQTAHALAQQEQADQQRQANDERAAQLAQMEAEQKAVVSKADEAVLAAQAAAETARKAMADAEAALKRANEQAQLAAAEAQRKLRETRAQAANELYTALSAVFGDAGFDALSEGTKELVTTALHKATFAASRATAAVEVAHA